MTTATERPQGQTASLDEYLAWLKEQQRLDGLRERQPSLFYRPHAGQVRMHKSRHKIRIMVVGNRWGKTTAAGIEADLTLQGSDRFGVYRPVPAQVLWFSPQMRQFDVLKAQLDATCLTQGYSFNGQDMMFTWANGSKMWVIPQDRDWKYIQGVNPSLVVMDEQPPRSLWNELQARGFGKWRTRYIIAATATDPLSWMEDEFYKPWMEYHSLKGMLEAQAMIVQGHPTIFCLPRGGIADNPIFTPAQVAEFEGMTWIGGEKEKRVRTQGGFANWAGMSVFDPDALDWQDDQAAAWLMDHPILTGSWTIQPKPAERFPPLVQEVVPKDWRPVV